MSLIDEIKTERKLAAESSVIKKLREQGLIDNMELPVNKTSDKELLELIYDDLKMRVSDEGLVNISGFIWDKLSKRLSSNADLVNDTRKLHLESFDIWRFEDTINIVRADGEAGGFGLDSFDKCVNKFFDNNF